MEIKVQRTLIGSDTEMAAMQHIIDRLIESGFDPDGYPPASIIEAARKYLKREAH